MQTSAILPVFVALPLIVAAIAALIPSKRFNDILALLIPAINLAGGIWLSATPRSTAPLATSSASTKAAWVSPLRRTGSPRS